MCFNKCYRHLSVKPISFCIFFMLASNNISSAYLTICGQLLASRMRLLLLSVYRSRRFKTFYSYHTNRIKVHFNIKKILSISKSQEKRKIVIVIISVILIIRNLANVVKLEKICWSDYS